MTSKKLVRPGSRLVVHDIHVDTVRLADGSEKVCAYVDCQRRKSKLKVDECRSCERLVRIDSHEAGYVIVCRAEDEVFDSDE
jgi:hypothetical protein